MKASDLPYDVKQELLKQIKQQVGWSEYDRIVDQVGEDGVIDLALAQLEDVSKAQASKKKKGFWSEWGWLLFWLVLAGLAAAAGQWEVVGWLFVLLIVLPLIATGWNALSTWWDRNMRFPPYR